jgi:hypothetical protein
MSVNPLALELNAWSDVQEMEFKWELHKKAIRGPWSVPDSHHFEHHTVWQVYVMLRAEGFMFHEPILIVVCWHLAQYVSVLVTYVCVYIYTFQFVDAQLSKQILHEARWQQQEIESDVGSSPHTPNKQVTKLGYAADEAELQDDMDGNSVKIL